MLRLCCSSIASLLQSSSAAIRTPTVATAAWFSSLSQTNASASASTSPSTSSASSLGFDHAPETGPVKPDLVDQYLSQHNMSHRQLFKTRKEDIIRQFQRHPGDVGSPEVTVAIWTHYIREQAKHFHRVPKHYHVMRHTEYVANKRRRLLAWLRRDNFEAYASTIHKLGLADVFGEGHKGDRYRVGVAHEAAEQDDTVRRRRFAFHREYKQKKTSMWRRLLPVLEREDPHLPAPPPASGGAGSVQARAASEQTTA